jgi:uncharacterized protein YrzB (UPF0473 family)
MAEHEHAHTDGAEMEETEALFVTLTDEDGEEETFQLVQTVEVDGRQYGVLVSAEADMDETGADGEADEDEEGDILILRVTQENGEEYFEEIEDDAEFQKVVKHLESMAA